jgi:hypothetical protein
VTEKVSIMAITATITIGSFICWYGILDEWFSGTVLADEGETWLVRRSIGGICSVRKEDAR